MQETMVGEYTACPLAYMLCNALVCGYSLFFTSFKLVSVIHGISSVHQEQFEELPSLSIGQR